MQGPDLGPDTSRRSVVIPLGLAQTLSMALVISALISPWAGRPAHRRAGRPAILQAAGAPLAALVLLTLGPVAALPFGVIRCLGNGLLIIVRGTLPLALFGAQGYGARQGWTMACGLGSLLLLLMVLHVPSGAAPLPIPDANGGAARQNRT